MRSLLEMNKEFIDRARSKQLPVRPREPRLPVIPLDRWQHTDQRLMKRYVFLRDGARDEFVMKLLRYEALVRHHALMTIDHDSVSLSLSTRDLDKVTELDKEYAAFADSVFKETVYSEPCR